MIAFEVVAEEVKWRGRLLRAGVETYHYSDGTRNTFDRVWHPGAVAVIAYDDTHLWLVRQPREAARLHASLELPAGKRDRRAALAILAGRGGAILKNETEKNTL